MPSPFAIRTHAITLLLSAVVAKWRLVGYLGAHATASADVVGITEEAGIAGRAVSVLTGYSGVVEASEALVEGDYITPAADGSGRAAKGTAGDNCGRARGACAAGDLVEMRFIERGAAPGAGGAGDTVDVTIPTADNTTITL